MSARVDRWDVGARNAELDASIARLASLPDVARIAVMPDAHVAEDVCVGTVTATRSTIIPAAVGGDIGCGMLTIPLGCDVDRLADARVAAAVFRAFAKAIPPIMHRSSTAPRIPDELYDTPLSAAALEAMKDREARLELGTIGRGNHFVEIQRDEQEALWLLVHSGSRAIGPAIRQHHTRHERTNIVWLTADSDRARAYLSDAAWAARYAARNRELVIERATDVLADILRAAPDQERAIRCDHNHVREEEHDGERLFVHRKGAMCAASGVLGIVPGSMGTASYHVEGRGHAPALCSSAHGAGRALSRGRAREVIHARDVDRQMRGVWFDSRLTDRLRDEAPAAYKNIETVMRAQRELVRITRRLEPVLSYKAA